MGVYREEIPFWSWSLFRHNPEADVAGVRTMPWPQALKIAKQICLGLAAAHEIGIIHRDINRKNILLMQEMV